MELRIAKKVGLLVFLGCFVLGGIASSQEFSPPGGVTIALSEEPPLLDPHVVESKWQSAVTNNNIYEALTRRKPEGGFEPYLATEWEQVAPTRWRFKLREDVVFTTGEKFDAEGAAYSINYYLDPEKEFGVRDSFFAMVERAEVVDQYTIDIITNRQDNWLPYDITFLRIVPPSILETEGHEGLYENPRGSGPYKFVEWKKGQYLIMEANEDWWGGTPRWQDAKYIFRTEESVRLAALLTGEAHFAELSPLSCQRAPVCTATQLGAETGQLVLNPNGGLTEDWRIRRAIGLAMNVDDIVNLYSGYAKPAKGQIFPEATYGFDPTITDWEYDLEEARHLVEEAGAVGKTIRYVSSSERWPMALELNSLIIGMIEETGLKVEASLLSTADWISELLAPGGREGKEERLKTIPEICFVYSSNERLHPSSSFGLYILLDGTGSRVLDPVVESLIEESYTADPEREMEIYSTVSRIIKERALIIAMVRKRLTKGLADGFDFEPYTGNLIPLEEIRPE